MASPVCEALQLKNIQYTDSWPSPNMGELPKLWPLHIATMNWFISQWTTWPTMTDWFISFAGIYQLIELISTAPSAAITPQKRSCPPPRGNSGCDLTVGINNSENKRASIKPRCADGVISVASVHHLWRLYNISDVRGITSWVQNMPSIVEICGITCVARASVAAQIAEGSGHKRGLGGKKQCRTCNNCT